MKELYYIVSVDYIPGLNDTETVYGVIVPYEEVFDFYQVALFGFGDNVKERDAEAERRRDAGESAYNDGTGCAINTVRWTEKEYFQKRLEGVLTLEEYRAKQ